MGQTEVPYSLLLKWCARWSRTTSSHPPITLFKGLSYWPLAIDQCWLKTTQPHRYTCYRQYE